MDWKYIIELLFGSGILMGVIIGLMKMSKNFGIIFTQFSHIEKKFESIDKKFESIDKRFDVIEKKLDYMDHKIESIDKRLSKMETVFEERNRHENIPKIYVLHNDRPE